MQNQNKHIAIVTDAWDPQVNGVVRVLKDRKRVLEEMGYRVSIIAPSDFKTITFKPYPEIKIAVFGKHAEKSVLTLTPAVSNRLKELKPDFIHIATAVEGPLGLSAEAFCKRNKISYTTELHSRIPEYVSTYVAQYAGDRSKPAITKMAYAWVRSHHGNSNITMVPSQSMSEELKKHGLKNLEVCPHGVDTELFHPGESHVFDTYDQPVFLYVGRVAAEKRIDKFLALDLPGTKVVVGDGPERKGLEKKFSGANVKFLGKKSGTELVAHYQGANVVVFPSTTDTFGNVNVEALACGKPVAAFPASGVMDIINSPHIGALDKNLRAACMQALELSQKKGTADACRKEAVDNYKWEVAAGNFKNLLVEVGAPNKSRHRPIDNIWNSLGRLPKTEKNTPGSVSKG